MKIACYICLLMLVLLSCEDKDICIDDSKNHGIVSISDSTNQFLNPYYTSKKGYFKDSLNNELVFNINSISSFHNFTHELSVSEYCSKRIKYEASLKENKIDLRLGSDLKFSIKSMPILSSPYNSLTKNEAISMVIYGKFGNITTEETLDLIHVYVGNKLHLGIEKEENIVLFGKSFSNTFVRANKRFYIQRNLGLIAFKDDKNKLWVFDRFE